MFCLSSLKIYIRTENYTMMQKLPIFNSHIMFAESIAFFKALPVLKKYVLSWGK